MDHLGIWILVVSQGVFRGSLAKEKVSMEPRSPTQHLCSVSLESNETLWFPGRILLPYPIALQPFSYPCLMDHSHVAICMLFEKVSAAQQVNSHNPAKETHEIRKSLARVNRLSVKNGRLQIMNLHRPPDIYV